MSRPVLSLGAAAVLVDLLSLTDAEADRMADYLDAALVEAAVEFATELRVRRTYDAERAAGATRRAALETCGARCAVSAGTAERIIDHAWGRQPEARAVS